jgi:hypothetical protein
LICCALASSGFNGCAGYTFISPGADTLHLAGLVDVEIGLPVTATPSSLLVHHDNGTTIADVTAPLTISGTTASGQIVNFCTGICDGVEVSDQPAGGPCDPLNP